MTDGYRAAVCRALAGPAAIAIETLPAASLGPGDVRIAVRAAGVNFPDVLMTYGKYQHRPDPPFVPGMEIAGEIIECGSGVSDFAVGDRVMSGGKEGGFAGQMIADAANVSRLPNALDFAEGATYRAGAVTAWHALVDRGQIAAGETILILGAAGGVGMAAVQLAKHLGATVIASASTSAKRAAILSAGADHTIDPAAADFVDQVKALGGGGVDLVYDPVGGDLALKATRTLAWGGRYLIVGFASGVIPQFPANHALIKGYSLIGLRAGEAGRRDAALGARNRAILADLAGQGVMRPHISHRIPLDRTADALRVLEQRQAIGRVVILP